MLSRVTSDSFAAVSTAVTAKKKDAGMGGSGDAGTGIWTVEQLASSKEQSAIKTLVSIGSSPLTLIMGCSERYTL